MAKMFYTLDEAAAKLGMTVDQVQQMTESGQLKEYNDNGETMLKVDQVDLLAGDDGDDGGIIPLAESGELEPISLASSDTGTYATENPMEATGISIFDPSGDDADPAAQTQVSNSMTAPDFLDQSSSGSGLANLQLESDDTSLGDNLLDDVYGDQSQASGAFDGGGSVLGQSAAIDTGGDLFEGGVEDTDMIGTPVMTAAFEEAYDGGGSGLVGGVAVGMIVTLLAAMTVMMLAIISPGTIVGGLTAMTVYVVLGVGLGVMLIGGVVGFLLLKNS